MQIFKEIRKAWWPLYNTFKTTEELGTESNQARELPENPSFAVAYSNLQKKIISEIRKSSTEDLERNRLKLLVLDDLYNELEEIVIRGISKKEVEKVRSRLADSSASEEDSPTSPDKD